MTKDYEESICSEPRSSSLVNDPSVETPRNASGHTQELDRNFSLASICGYAITSGNTWVAIGGSVTIAISNGGPAGVIYEFIAVEVFFWLVAASIAELASAVPSAGGVYHWASITAGPYGRVCGWFAGYWNVMSWIWAVAAVIQITALQVVSMYALFDPGFTPQRWQVFVVYLVCTWVCCLPVLFANKVLPLVQFLAGALTVGGLLITVIVCAIVPKHASNASVWSDWHNTTGYKSDVFAFLLGMLNGAFACGDPDIISHLAEEVPNPSVNLPKAIFAQYVCGFFTAIFYLVAIFYGISDLESVLKNTYLFPITEIYRQITNSPGGSLGLLILSFVSSVLIVIGLYITLSRGLWTLARDNALPFSKTFGRISHKHQNPYNTILFCPCACTLLGFIYLGSSTAFNAFVGSYFMLSTLSYLMAILPHLLSKRSRVTPGWFWMKGVIGYIVNGLACLLIVVFVVIFCFPFTLPATAGTMNYASSMSCSLSLFVAAFWFWRRKEYVGPQAFHGYIRMD